MLSLRADFECFPQTHICSAHYKKASFHSSLSLSLYNAPFSPMLVAYCKKTPCAAIECPSSHYKPTLIVSKRPEIEASKTFLNTKAVLIHFSVALLLWRGGDLQNSNENMGASILDKTKILAVIRNA